MAIHTVESYSELKEFESELELVRVGTLRSSTDPSSRILKLLRNAKGPCMGKPTCVGVVMDLYWVKPKNYQGGWGCMLFYRTNKLLDSELEDLFRKVKILHTVRCL